MSWNHKDKLQAMGIALQPTAGTFVLPGTADLIGASSISNKDDKQSATDGTQTGSIFESKPVKLGRTSSGGGTIPLRGPGGTAPPAANAWVLGRLMQACGFAEIIKSAASTATLQGGTATSLTLAASESSVDDALIGLPIQQTAIGIGFRQTSLIQDYVGATKQAVLAETLGTASPSGSYTLPAALVYLLGTLTTAPPLLSISVWRDRRRYDYRDCVITSWAIDVPVANDAAQSFPAITFEWKGVPVKNALQVTTPLPPQALLNISPPAARGGKFAVDRVPLGHASSKFTLAFTAGAASDGNADAGQDAYDILSGTRTLDFDLNQMDVADFDYEARVDSDIGMPMMHTWGGGSGNNMGVLYPNISLDPASVGSRNGYVSLTGNGQQNAIDKSMALSFWY